MFDLIGGVASNTIFAIAVIILVSVALLVSDLKRRRKNDDSRDDVFDIVDEEFAEAFRDRR